MCSGTIVVGFKAGAPETISILEYSEFVDFGDLDALRKSLYKWLSIESNKETISSIAIQRYDAEKMYKGYCSYYADIIKK